MPRPQHSVARSALCEQPVLPSFLDASEVLRGELASDTFGKNWLDVVYLLFTLALVLSLRIFDLTQY